MWRPDVIGSICFLVASYLAWAEVCHSVGRLRFRELAWWIVLGVLRDLRHPGVLEPAHGRGDNLRWDNGGTCLGALCFLIAAVLLIPEARSVRAPADSG